jgi:hypothetical protein
VARPRGLARESKARARGKSWPRGKAKTGSKALWQGLEARKGKARPCDKARPRGKTGQGEDS